MKKSVKLKAMIVKKIKRRYEVTLISKNTMITEMLQ